jgi:hypothetical protein
MVEVNRVALIVKQDLIKYIRELPYEACKIFSLSHQVTIFLDEEPVLCQLEKRALTAVSEFANAHFKRNTTLLELLLNSRVIPEDDLLEVC